TLPPGRRLSCSATIERDLVVDVPQDAVTNAQVVRKDADDRVIERHPAVHLCYVEVPEPGMHHPLGDLDRLKAQHQKDWGFKRLEVHSQLLQDVQQTLGEGEWAVTAAIPHDEEEDAARINALWPGLKNEAFGIACDIGSTTIAIHLVSLLSGQVVAS